MAKKAIRKAPAKKAKKAKKVKKAKKAKKTVKAAAKTKSRTAAPRRKSAKKAAPTKKAPRAVKAKQPLKKSPLTRAELKEFRKMLMAKRRDLMGDMNGIEAEAFRSGREGSSGDLSNMPTHPADIGTDNYEHEFTLGLLESERSLLLEIEEALERVDKGIFGICLGTGQPIRLARLRARAWAKYSIEYARQIEQGLVSASQQNDVSNDDDNDPSGDED